MSFCRCIKQLGWLIAVVQSFLIIASRKHYTVDVTVAWYVSSIRLFDCAVIISIKKKMFCRSDFYFGSAIVAFQVYC
jgi:hypothetical protein